MLILVVDERENRRRLLARAIREKWRIRVEEDPGLDGGVESVRRLGDKLQGGKIIWWSNARVLEFHQQVLRSCPPGPSHSTADLIQIEDDNSRSRIETRFGRIALSQTPDDITLEQELRQLLGPSPSPPRISLLNRLDDRVRRLIAGLGPSGMQALREVVFQLFPGSRTAKIGWVGEGYSNSRLFSLVYRDGQGNTTNRVLKLTPVSERQKCVDELDRYPELPDSMYGRLIPRIFRNESGGGTQSGEPGVAEFGEWVGVAYEFIGSENEPFCDLAQSYLRPDDPCFESIPNREDPAKYVITCCLQSMRIDWHAHCRFEDRHVWSGETDDARSGRDGFPPYRLKLPEKRDHAKCISTLGRYGRTLLPHWEEDVQDLSRICWEGLQIPNSIAPDGKMPMLLSQVHGDLNGGNIRCNIARNHAFLIDLAWYRESSHTLQDFARLEIELKFVLMDSGQGCGKWMDLPPQLLDSWIEVESVLCNDTWTAPLNVSSTSISRCGARAIGLVEFVRRQAFGLHNELVDRSHASVTRGHFILAYLAALLYGTLRAVAFTTLPIVKRVFAVHSAAAIVRRLESSR